MKMVKFNFIKKFDVELDFVKETGIIYHKIKNFDTKTFLISFKEKVKIISTLDGFKKVFYVGNNYISCSLWDFVHMDFERYKRFFYSSLKIPKSKSSFLFTGRDIETISVHKEIFKDIEIYVFSTVGVKSNALRIGVDEGKNYQEKDGKFIKLGTVNIIVLTNMRLTEGALASSLINITEAKTSVFQDLDIRSSYTPMKNQATGTGTDNIVFVSGNYGKITYTQGHSKFGEILAKSVYISVKDNLKNSGLIQNRSFLEKLEERGIKKEDIIEAAMEVYIEDEKFGNKEKIRKIFENELEKISKDVNISLLIIAGLKIEEEAEKENIPNLTYKAYKDDAVFIVSDEIIGKEIAQYIGGTLALFEYERIDKIKPGIIKKLPPFLDDIIGGLIAGIMVRIFSK
ncbi:MAG: phosphatidylglycerophosphatase A [Candidatus Omnitrophica bacterium]|nr:phosphatidylglycerophosphatase A [Candidatus Omnitrophota bacterium]MCM8802346.1 phosphatidylglycerophosphatase A [Candidatus Omnitrophota bacterium]